MVVDVLVLTSVPVSMDFMEITAKLTIEEDLVSERLTRRKTSALVKFYLNTQRKSNAVPPSDKRGEIHAKSAQLDLVTAAAAMTQTATTSTSVLTSTEFARVVNAEIRSEASSALLPKVSTLMKTKTNVLILMNALTAHVGLIMNAAIFLEVTLAIVLKDTSRLSTKMVNKLALITDLAPVMNMFLTASAPIH